MASDLEVCMERAAPLLPDFHDAWRTAMATYLKTPAEYRAEYNDSTVAAVIRSHMWTEIVRRFSGRAGCTLLRLNQLNLLIYRDLSVWRFKKVDGAGRHQNYQTVQQRAFDNQDLLPGIPEAAVRLTSGYEPTPLGDAIERVIVARPYSTSIQWAAQVNIVDATPSWVEITPKRFTGTERFDRKKPHPREGSA